LIGALAISLLSSNAFLATLLGWVVDLIFALIPHLSYIIGLAQVSVAAGYAIGSTQIFVIADNLQIVASVAGIVLAIVGY